MFDNLSFWEKDILIHEIDHCIIGGGIVGLTTAICLKELDPKAKVVVLERGVIGHGASTKNAGFTCFGSVTEILDDLNHMSESEVISLIRKRGKGLERLMQRVDGSTMNYYNHGSSELFLKQEEQIFHSASSQIKRINGLVEEALSYKDTFRVVDQDFGFNAFHKTIVNRYEGQIHPMKMIMALRTRAINLGVLLLNGINVKNVDVQNRKISIGLHSIEIPGNIVLCTNAFTTELYPLEDLVAYRNQVLITEPIPELNWKKCFHMDKGYVYFRNVGNRVLIGGARNIDMEKERTTAMESNDNILTHLKELLSNIILPNHFFKVEHSWSGIIATGSRKSPIIDQISDKVYFAGRSGGMGVAIGSLVGEEMAQRINMDEV